MNETIRLLLTRRSVPAAMLVGPGPSEEETRTLLTIASRVPDHGKLAPWRFVLIRGDAGRVLGERLQEIVRADQPDADSQKLRDEGNRFSAPLVIAVVSRAGPHVKIPKWEQVLSAGAVCMNLVTAASAMGFAANWLSGWFAYDRRFLDLLEISHEEEIAGFIHIGRSDAAPADRPRPALDEIVSEFRARQG